MVMPTVLAFSITAEILVRKDSPAAAPKEAKPSTPTRARGWPAWRAAPTARPAPRLPRPSACRLIGFVRLAWKILEPNTTFVENWHIHAICEHLEAVTEGRITRLLITVPPGSMKSLLVSVL
jgi:hypothetical protein